MAHQLYNKDKDFDYQKLIDVEVAAGNLTAAGEYEKMRNAKIEGEGLNYAKTYNYHTPENVQASTLPKGAFDVSKVTQGSQAVEDALAKILNQTPFSYNPSTDPTYKQYEEQYTRQGKEAASNVLAQVSARTGGLASSYAGVASQQQNEAYMAALADKIPELRQAAYDMYDAQYKRDLNNYNLLYGREQDTLANDWKERTFERSNLESDRNYGLAVSGAAQQQANWNKTFEYSAQTDASAQGIAIRDDARNQISSFLANGGSINNVPKDVLSASGLDIGYWTAYEMQVAKEMAAAEKQTARSDADWLAGYGDSSGIAGLGVNPSRFERQWEQSLAPKSGGSGSSGSSSKTEQNMLDTFYAIDSEDRAYSYLVEMGVTNEERNNLMSYWQQNNAAKKYAGTQGSSKLIQIEQGLSSMMSATINPTTDAGRRQIENYIASAWEKDLLTDSEFTSLMKKYGLDIIKYYA